jgi:hypothetical protein
MIKNYVFTGQEAEGPQKGILTLFIPKNAINRTSFFEFAKKYNITRLYFGAGNDRGINPDLIGHLKWIPKHFTIFLEILKGDDLKLIPPSFLKRTNIIYVIQDYLEVNPSVFKIESKKEVNWYELQKPFTNSLDSKLYEWDQDL